MYTCKNDFVFKTVMGEKREILRSVSSYFVNLSNNFNYIDTEQKKKTLKERKRIVDLLIENNDTIIDFEVNNNPTEDTFDRNLGYICKIFSDSFKRGKKIKYKRAVLVNLNYGYKGETKISKYLMKDEVNKVLTENIIIYNVDMDKLKKSYYNKDEDTVKKYKYLIMLDLSDEELENFEKGDEIVETYRKTITDINGNVLFQPLFTREEKIAFQMEERFEQGVEQEKINTAKNMLEMTDDLSFISKATGLSLKAISELNTNKS